MSTFYEAVEAIRDGKYAYSQREGEWVNILGKGQFVIHFYKQMNLPIPSVICHVCNMDWIIVDELQSEFNELILEVFS